MASQLPAATEAGVFSVSAKREIEAPIDKVWDVLTDLPRYHEWNAFVRAMIIVDASKSPDADQTLAEGKYLMMKVHMPPTMDDTVRSQVPFEVIKTVDREKHRLSWINIDYPQWALRAERWQVLSTVDGKTLYETREVFAGLLAYILKWFMAGSLRKSFDAFADGLKHRSEQL